MQPPVKLRRPVEEGQTGYAGSLYATNVFIGQHICLRPLLQGDGRILCPPVRVAPGVFFKVAVDDVPDRLNDGVDFCLDVPAVEKPCDIEPDSVVATYWPVAASACDRRHHATGGLSRASPFGQARRVGWGPHLEAFSVIGK